MYAVVHGGLSLELRQQSIDYLASLPFDGMAVGGSLGKNRYAKGCTALLCCTALHRTALHCTAPHGTALHCC